MDSLNVRQGSIFSISNLWGRIPFEFSIDPIKKQFLPDTNYAPLKWVEYERERELLQHLSPIVGNLKIKEVNAAGYQIKDVVMDVDAANGYVQIPWFQMALFDGNVGGNILVRLGTGMKQDISYEIRAQAARINAAVLGNLNANIEEETELDATLSFTGKGIDPAQGLDLEGFFHITKIGSNFASTLLKNLDPKDSDRSIRLTRRLLNTGWKPNLFSFELRHGYVYPSLALSQPWFSPIRIPGKLEFGRLPLAFFIKNKQANP